MSLLSRIFFNAVFGGLGGLLAWMLHGVFFDVRAEVRGGVLLLRGAVIGACIGYLVVAVEAIRDRALLRFNRLATYGLILGALGGAVGLSLGEMISVRTISFWLVEELGSPRGNFFIALALMLARGIGWMFLGLAVGMSEGIAARSLGKFSYGAVGGSLGGFVGGCLFHLIYVTSQETVSFSGAMGLVILGACIGSLSALVRGIFQPASVKVMRGWQEGREYSLDKRDNTLGRDEHVDVALFRDMRVEKYHAIIQREGNRFLLVNTNAPPDYTRVNGVPVPHYQELHDGDRIELGQVVLRFQTRGAVNRNRRNVPVALAVGKES
jgi:hypothetical protein